MASDSSGRMLQHLQVLNICFASLPRRALSPATVQKQEEEGHDESSETMWSRICMEAEPVPCHKDSKVLMSTQLPGTLRDFFDLFIASDSPFYEEVLVEQGNRCVRPHTSPRSATPPFTQTHTQLTHHLARFPLVSIATASCLMHLCAPGFRPHAYPCQLHCSWSRYTWCWFGKMPVISGTRGHDRQIATVHD